MSKLNVALDAREFVKFWFKTNAKTALNARKTVSIFSTLYLDYGKFFIKTATKHPNQKLKMLSEAILKHAYIEYVGATIEQEVMHAMDDLVCKSEDLTPIRTWVMAVTGAADTKDVAVMAHWVWTAKRKGTGQPVKHQIMPVLYGPQGGGKTIALEKLIAPISDFRLTISMSQLGDERVFEGLANHFVALFDELQGIERTDMNALKKQITTTTNSYRKLYTHDMANIPMRCSFIGATNRPIAESFNDSTGMRRFWEVNTLKKLQWDVLGDIDYKELWKGVDENKEEGYLTGEALEAVLHKQTELVNKDDLEEFLSQHNLHTTEDDTTAIEIANDALYEAYVHWAGRNGITSKLNAIWFGRKLKRRLPSQVNKNASGVPQRVYKINLHNKLSNLKLNS